MAVSKKTKNKTDSEYPKIEITEGKHDLHLVVKLFSSKDDKYGTEIGAIRQLTWGEPEKKGKPSWRISRIGGNHIPHLNTIESFDSYTFHSKEEAAEALKLIVSSIAANPVPQDIQYYLSRESEEIHREQQAMRGHWLHLKMRKALLERLAREYKINLIHMDHESSTNVKNLVDFLDESVDAIYDNMGKDWARTLKSLIKGLIEEVDPESAQAELNW